MKGRPRKRVGVLIETYAGFMRDMIAGISRYVRQADPGWEIRFQPRPASVAEKLAEFGHIDGLIAHPNLPAQWVRRSRCPVVAIEQYASPHPAVIADNYAIGRLAYEHLRSKGLKRFAIWSLKDLIVFDQRREGFANAVAGGDHELIPIPPVLEDTYAASHVQAKVLRDWVKSVPKPLGLLVANVDYARRVVAACRDQGLEVPDEIAVLGVDHDNLVTELASPPVSIIDHGMVKAGYEAAALLHRLMQGEAAPEGPVIVQPLGIVERQSTDTQAVDNPDVRYAMRIIRERAVKGLQVKEVLDEVPVARRTLEIAFQRHFGRSIRQEIQRVRITRARQLLIEADYNLDQLARMCGYEHASRLSEAFKRETGMPPAEFRRRYR